MAEISIGVGALLREGVESHNAGRRDEAARRYRRVLTLDPVQADALNLSGVILRQTGDYAAAARLLGRARSVRPDLHGVEVNLDNAVIDALNAAGAQVFNGACDAAWADMQELLLYSDDRADVLTYAATIRLIMGDDAGAARYKAAADKRRGAEPPPRNGLSVAIDAVARHAEDYGFAGTVVIPAFRAADYVAAALDSIVAAVDHRRQAAGDPRFKVHVAVVDDCSPDATPDVVRAWARRHPDQSVSLIANNQNRGAGRSRNAGAEAAFGSFLWFLDADDYFLPNHFDVTLRGLEALPDVGYVRTGIRFDRIDDKITDDWRQASEHTYPCNLCVRRECHELVGGFPQEYPFGPAGPEDVGYSRSLQCLFMGGKTAEKTVFYSMRPGNILDKLHKDMLDADKPPGVGVTPEAEHTAVEILIRRRLRRLDGLRGMTWSGPPFTPDRRTRLRPF